MPPSLVVATTSRYRLELLDRLGLVYTAVAHRVDELAAAPRGTTEHATRALAIAKAESLAPLHPEALILGADQMVELAGERLGKPGTAAAAAAQLARMAGRSHRLVTTVALRAPDGHVDTATDVHVMKLRPLSGDEIARYVARDRPLDCAGSYKIEGLGIALVESMVGADHTGIIGLPLIATLRLLRAAGLDPLAA
jgi:septum formation protein